MRLINVVSLEIEEFRGSSTPKYAILSHTWAGTEASFGEWTKPWTRLRKRKQPAFAKIMATCKQARRDGLSYVWADTVCIDKSSSAELSEAINSMYTWYEKASICYVYLADVTSTPKDQMDRLDLVRQSRWFTRGWTLQELLAPTNTIFYSSDWAILGTKNALAVLISDVTGIDRQCLHKTKRLDQYSIAQRMAWASSRSTTREEDIAYSLMGIFSINMPLLYGEGKKAFRRLQEEIIKVSDDHSILAFDTDLSEETLFAHHPSIFNSGRDIHPNFAPKITPPFSMTNAGLSISTPLVQTLSPFWVLALLNCVEVNAADHMKRKQICLPLFGKDGKYMRARAPVSLISKTLDEPSFQPQLRPEDKLEIDEPSSSSTSSQPTDDKTSDEILDLTTQTDTNYFISYFSRIYSVYGTEMDIALKGFGLGCGIGSPTAGFMLTFPRGMNKYEIFSAFPAGDLREDISFFLPTRQTDPKIGHPGPPLSGIIVFANKTVHPWSKVYLYLTLDLDGGIKLRRWGCQVGVPSQAELREPTSLLSRIDEQYMPDQWKHYQHGGNTIVAARTRFTVPAGQPCNEVIMVEVVFDADQLMSERDLFVVDKQPLVLRQNMASYSERDNGHLVTDRSVLTYDTW